MAEAVLSNITAFVPRSLDGRPSPLDHPELRWPQYDADEVHAAALVLESGRVNSLVHGEHTRELEREFAAYCGAPHAIAVSNGTTALELALRALGVGPGDEVIVPSRSFFATAAAVVAVGATPAFADIDPVSQTIDAASARSIVTSRTRAVICVHLAGWPCEMTELLMLAHDAHLWLIEDCAQAHGATYDGRRVGTFGHAAAFSFCTDKIMSTGGEGGIVLFQDHDHWAKAWAFKDHGKNPDKVLCPVTGHCFRYVHDSFGTNWRMTEMQAAIGVQQLAKLPRWLDQRRRNAEALMTYLQDEPCVELPHIPSHAGHAFYRLYVTIARACLGPEGNTNRLIERMIEMGMPVSSGSCADMSRETAFDDMVVRRADGLRIAAEIGRRTIAFPVDHLLDESDMRRMANCLRIALAEAHVVTMEIVQ
ncbi:DegT/DnrJ/EryC1/StrS family aminotransferase [Sphingomonas sp. EC-HK361]|uniref:DegT/DnrJ/EryC1/StrS family aminotransferase n=1 Tax=Sphingomonas sp. EC-HK361 TaxID=2038397 RepID=UPI001F2F8591|nr:DegT/DnrJ/EryC1/StrS family aminotransferase [Sphingomonas sp. EC-HK361]